jgi:hypothetical protein
VTSAPVARPTFQNHVVLFVNNILDQTRANAYNKSWQHRNEFQKDGRNATGMIQTKTPLAVNAKQNAGNLENAVDKVATNGSTGTEDGCITQLLAKLLTVLLDLARSLAFAVTHT